MVGGGHEEVLDKVFLPRSHGGFSLAAAALALVEGDGVPLDIPRLGDRHHHVFFCDHVFHGQLARGFDDFRPACVPEPFLNLAEFFFDDAQHDAFAGEDLLEPGDVLEDVRIFLEDLLLLEAGEPLKAHVEDGLGLEGAEREGFHEAVLGLLGRIRCTDQGHHVVQVLESDLEAFQDMGTLFRFP